MANIIQIRHTVSASSVPASLERGELAVNITDRRVWVGDATKQPLLMLDAANTPVIKASYRGTITGGVLTQVSARNMTVTRQAAGSFFVDVVGMTIEDMLLADVFGDHLAEAASSAANRRLLRVYNVGMMARSPADPPAIHIMLLGIP